MIFDKFTWYLALKYLNSSRKEGAISLTAGFSFLGIALGVAALIVVMSVMNGYRAELIELTTGLNGHISLWGKGGIENYQQVVDELKNTKRVIEVTPEIERQVMLQRGNSALGVNLHGVNLTDLKEKKLISENIVIGSLSNLSDRQIAIGKLLATKLNLLPGDKINILTTATNSTFLGGLPRVVEVEIVAIFESGMTIYDEMNIYAPLDLVQKIFRLGGKVEKIDLNITDPEHLIEITDSLENKYPAFNLVTWQQSNASILQALEIEKAVMFIILTLIIAVAGFNIIASLSMLVNFKNKEIAILRTIGLSKVNLVMIFAKAGFLIGVIGNFIGVVIGYLVAKNIEPLRQFLMKFSGMVIFDPLIYYLNLLPTKIAYQDIINISALTMFFSIIAAMYPAWKAAKLNPAQVVKND